jgi:hypothetical protein
MVLGSGIREPGSGIRKKKPFRIPDPGVKKAPDPGSRIRIRNTGLYAEENAGCCLYAEENAGCCLYAEENAGCSLCHPDENCCLYKTAKMPIVLSAILKRTASCCLFNTEENCWFLSP